MRGTMRLSMPMPDHRPCDTRGGMYYPDILSIRSEPIVSSYTDKDTMLYALSIGMGSDPRELPFVYEKALRAMPTMATQMARGVEAVILGGGIDYAMIVHGEQRLRIHKPLPATGSVASTARCLGVADKGPEKGAVVDIECALTDPETGELFASLVTSLFCRGDGGCGGPRERELVPHEVPSRPHDIEVRLPTRPDQALLFRLNGDRTALHADPEVARKVGFERPILHGLCTYGIACRALLHACCDYDPARIRSFDVRFASPVYPGETIVTRLWKDGPVVSFECEVAERSAIVLRGGRCEIAD